MEFSKEICQQPEASLSKEWLETNGIGGYASSSIPGCHTRKYHGFLVPSFPQLHNKFVTLSKMTFSVVIDGREVELTTTHYPGSLHPEGYRYLVHFNSEPCPTWVYEVGDVRLTIKYALIQGQNTGIFHLHIEGPNEVEVLARPFLSYRVNHELTKQNVFLNGNFQDEQGVFHMAPYDGMPHLLINATTNLKSQPQGDWHLNVEFYRERERGFDHHEDVFCPMTLSMMLKPNESVAIGASHEGSAPEDLMALWAEEMESRAGEDAVRSLSQREEIQTLLVQGRQFLTRNARGELSITAGFPWFVEWGRDTMIALPGLTIERGQPDLALEVLSSYAKHEKDGLIPNYLAIGDGEHAYNSIDASLWFFWAIGELHKVQGYRRKIQLNLVPTMENIIETYMNNRVPKAQLREDGLIAAGNPGTQLTWMDANAYGRPATPRNGCPVEINALFIHAMYLYLDLRPKNKQLKGVRELYEKARSSFAEAFWLPEEGYLADVLEKNEPDKAIRPNQIFALSLESCPLSVEQKRSVVDVVRRHLLTPYGMRTLNPDHPCFRPRYEGNGDERDSAYHQGTVWPWLLGHFIEASLICAEDPKAEAQSLAETLQPLIHDHLPEYGIGSVAEVYDATEPYRPGGTIAQAWSVSELIRGFRLIDQALEA